MSDRIKYLAGALVAGFIISWYFIGNLMASPNEYFFSRGGDGLQAYYQSQYHVAHDTTYLHQQGMNYPFGESIFFTGGQPFISNVIKAIKPAADLSHYMVGITNLTMLLGIFVCIIFIYLLLVDHGTHGFYAAFVAVGLTFFTQQWERMTGHFPLAYLYAIPGMIYFLQRFYRSPSWKWSIVLCLYMTFLVMAHVYYIAFFGVISIAWYFVFVLLNRRRSISIIRSTFHLLIQLIVPFIILQLLIWASTDVSDRTSVPWGFLVYRSGWAGYIFPYGMSYESLFNDLRPVHAIEWEGLAYLGGAAIAGLIVCLLVGVTRVKSFANNFQDRKGQSVFAMVIAAALCIIISFAFPFNYGFEKLLYKIGAIQQFRGIGRFALPAFYLVNFAVFISLWYLPLKSKVIRFSLFGVFGLVLLADAWSRMSIISPRIQNERAGSLAAGNPPVDPASFQAILPLPFFHIGSENIWADCDPELKEYIYNLSYRTGLPTFAASMSRTSISQSLMNYSLAQECMEKPHVVELLPDNRDVLVVYQRNSTSHHYRDLLEFGIKLKEDGPFDLYSLPLDAWAKLHEKNKYDLADMMKNNTGEIVFARDSSDRSTTICYVPSDTTMDLGMHWLRYYEGKLPPDWRGDTISISFWVQDFGRDLIPRTTLEVIQKNSENVVDYYVQGIGKTYAGMKDGHALVECLIPVKKDAETMTISFENKLLDGKKLTLGSLLIRPERVDCLILRTPEGSVNNRIY